MATNEPPYPSADPSLAYDLAKNSLAIQLSAVDALDSKIATGIALATTLAAITLAFLGIRVGQGESLLSKGELALMVTTGVAYFAALTLLIVAIRSRTLETGLRAQDVWDVADDYRDDMDVLYWWAARYFIDSVSANDAQYRRKLTLGTWGFVATAVQLGLGGASILATFV